MTKKDVLIGAFIVFFLWMFFYGFIANTWRDYPEFFDLLPNIAWLKSLITFVGVFSSLYILIAGTWDLITEKSRIFKFGPQFALRITIPGFFIIPVTLLMMGSVIMFMGHMIWGYGLTCLSIPALVIITLIGLRKIGKGENLTSEDETE